MLGSRPGRAAIFLPPSSFPVVTTGSDRSIYDSAPITASDYVPARQSSYSASYTHVARGISRESCALTSSALI